MPSSQLLIDPTTNRIISTGMSYDAAGNMTSDSTFNYAFDADNRITTVSAPGVLAPIATYAYDFAGHRVIKNGRVYIYVGGRVIAEYAAGTGPSSPDVEYVYAGNRRVATLKAGSMTYHYWDHLSVRASADASGKVIRSYGSFPFGETWYENGVLEKWKFTTYEQDESGLNYAGARFHSPALGRFMSLDPVAGHLGNPQSLNRYAYVSNNPINSTDQTGRVCDMGCDDDEGGGGGGGGGEGAGGGGDNPCGPFECTPDPTPDPTPDDLPDAPQPKPEVLQQVNEIDFVFNGADATPQLSGGLNDLSSLTPTVQTGSQSLNGNDDVAVGMDIFHNSAECPGCGTLWRESATWGNRIFAATGIVIAGVPLAGEGFLVAANLTAQATGWISGLLGPTGVVLGKYAEDPEEVIGYLQQAAAYGMKAYDIGDKLFKVFDKMGVAWTANQAFLDASIYRGQQFFISSTNITGYYWMEIQYLASRGIGLDQMKGLFIEY